MNKIIEQINRTERWQERLKKFLDNNENIDNQDDGVDILYSFFQNCWHIKDWIINSNVLEREIVNDFFHCDDDLKICRDLTNGSKHFVINNPSIDKNIKIDIREYTSSVGGSPIKKEITYYVKAKNFPPLNALSLAERCLVSCKFFLRNNKINIT
jgi:hypothetical protein